MERKVYVLWWKSLDKANPDFGIDYGIVGVYDSRELADKNLGLLEVHGDPTKEFGWEEHTVEGS